MERDANISHEIRQNACELVRAHPLPSLSDIAVTPMRLLPTFQSLTPALPETLAALDPDLLPQDTLHQLAQAEPTTLKTPEAALQPIPLAASSSKSTVMQPPPPRPLSFSSSSPGLSSEQEQFDPVAFFDSFVQDSLQLNSGKAKAREPQPSESEPSDSDIEMISNSRTPSPSKKRQASKKAAKASPHKTLAAASHFLQLAHQLLQAHEQQQQNEASPECCKALCKHLSEVAKHNAGKQIWTSSIADGSDKLTTSQLAKLIKILFSSVSPALKIQPIPAETLKAINNPTLATVKSNRGKKPTTKSKGSRAPTVASFGNNEDGPASPSKTGKSKRGRGRRASSSASMSAGSKSEDSEGEQQEESARSKKGKGKASTSQSGHWTLDQARQFEQDLETVFSASSASATILALLNVDKLPKKIYSEDIIDSCLHLIKTQLSSLIYPLAVCSAASTDGRDSALNQAFDLSSTAQDSAEELLSLYPSILPRVTALLKVEDMPEAILIKAVYISIGPFFVDLQQQESTTSSRSRAKGKAKEVTSPGFVALKTIRLAAFALIRVVYARYSAQRQWIVEEILTSLTQMPDKKKKAYVLKNGKCIQTVSALLFHLVQSTAHHVVPKVRLKIERLQSDAGNSEDDPEALEDAKRQACQHSTSQAMEAANSAAGLIISFLLKKTKSAVKNTAELDYKIALENIVNDALTVFDMEEWPSAQIIVNNCLTRMLNVVVVTEETMAESNALKGTCLEHLASIAGHLFARKNIVAQKYTLLPLSQLLVSSDTFSSGFEELCVAWHDLIGSLWLAHDEDDASENAAAFATCSWASELLRALDKVSSSKTTNEATWFIEGAQVHSALVDELLNAWSVKQQYETRRLSSEAEVSPDRRTLLVQSLSWTAGQAEVSELLMKRILLVLEESTIASHRSKAIKCLEAIVAEDTEAFARTDVRQAIEERFKDAQASVRDAAFDLLGKHVVDRPDLAIDYLPHIVERINDKGVNVRKRALKLLKRLHSTSLDEQSRTTICNKILWRIRDDDTAVRDLAIAAVEEMIFDASIEERAGGTPETHIARTLVLVSEGQERIPPLEEALKQIASKKAQQTEVFKRFLARLNDIAAVVIDFLLDLDSCIQTAKVGCARVLEVLARVHPKVIGPNQLQGIIPLLNVSTEPRDRAIRDSLLRAILSVTPHLPSAALPVCRKLQQVSIVLLSSTASLNALQVIVPCLCTVIITQTRDFIQLSRIFLALKQKLFDHMSVIQNGNTEAQSLKTHFLKLSTLIWNVALLCEHADFDKLRDTYPEAVEPVDLITDEVIYFDTFSLLVTIYSNPEMAMVRHQALGALGFLFRAYPSLMVEDEAVIIMDSIFNNQNKAGEERVRLIQVIQDFLAQQAVKADEDLEKTARPQSTRSDSDTDLDITDLIGNTETFADSGVGSAVVQRHLHHILHSAKSENVLERNAAFNIIGYTIRQGLAHPLSCLPTIVAIECSWDPVTSKRAFALHTELHTKHAQLIHTHFLQCATEAFEYQQHLKDTTLPPRGYHGVEERPSAFFSQWYSLVKENRPLRRQWVGSLVKGLQIDPIGVYDKSKTDLTRFLVDNLATLDYKAQEDIFTVILECDRILAETAMQTLELMRESLRQTCKIEDDEGVSLLGRPVPPVEHASLPSLIEVSHCVSLVAMLKDHLKKLYGLTDTKCKKFKPNVKTAMGDKAPSRHTELPFAIDLSLHPHLQPKTEQTHAEAYVAQFELFNHLISNDSAFVNPEEEEAEEVEE